MNQVIGLFPTPVMRAANVAPQALRERILTTLRKTATQRNAHDARLAHTAMVRPEDDRDFAALADALRPHLTAFGAMLMGQELTWLIKEMWVNVLQTGGHQAMHNHANSFVSAVIYLTPTGERSRTVFYRPIGGGDFAFANENDKTQMTPFNAKKWAAPAMDAGDAILFPSYLLHEVPPNPGGERVTIALNSLPERIESWGYAVSFA